MIINKVTITGADDSIEPSDLLKISMKYPFVEWAILLSKNSAGMKRFPSKKWMEELLNTEDGPICLAGHLCGSWLRDNLMKYGDDSFKNEIPLWNWFSRIQLNFHGEKFEVNEYALKALRELCWKEGKKFIIQMDGVNNSLYQELSFAGVYVEPLFDLSHGTGILPETGWPEEIPSVNPGAYRGYAGGLGPDNIAQQLISLANTVGPDRIWIDMETKVRSNNDLQFDLDKVMTVLEIASRYVSAGTV